MPKPNSQPSIDALLEDSKLEDQTDDTETTGAPKQKPGKGGKPGAGHRPKLGTSKDDVILGTAADSVVLGRNGKDRIEGGEGNDQLDGGNGKDILLGGNGDDILIGGNGKDVLVGGAGADLLTGGSGKDLFVLDSLQNGIDTITDYRFTDQIDLKGIFAAPEFGGADAISRFQQFVQLVQVGADTEVRLDADGNGVGATFSTLAVLKNIAVDTLSVTNFVIG